MNRRDAEKNERRPASRPLLRAPCFLPTASRTFLVFLCVLCASAVYSTPPLWAQTVPRLSDLRFSAGVQLVGIWTTGAEADINGDHQLEPVSDRFNFSLRRARFSISGRVAEELNLEFRVVFYYDNVGRDKYTGTRAGTGDGSVGIWDAFWMWRAQPSWANITVGYFRPQIGRENLTSGFQTNSSMDKLPTQVYQRAHLLNRSSGRALGINLGGLHNRPKWGVNYNAGVFDPSNYSGVRWSPLVVGRVALTLGDPEMETYGIDYLINYFNRRKGLTLATSYAHQGPTDFFRKNETWNCDLLANYGSLNLDAELDFLRRRTPAQFLSSDRVWHVRSGYNIRAPRSTWLEPVVALMRFRGDRYSVYPNGRDRLLDMGVNWYVRETRVKLNLHCTRQKGSGVSNLSDGTTFLRGNMVGMGLQFVY
jgi:hypothetical protein